MLLMLAPVGGGEPVHLWPELHPLEAELGKVRQVMGALEACPPPWWADKLLWQGLRLFCGMRRRGIGEALEKLTH